MNLKEKWHSVQDSYDAFMQSHPKQLVAAAIAGFVIGLFLGYMR
jgi:hypothetical protein